MTEEEFWRSTPRKMYMLIEAYRELTEGEKHGDLSWLFADDGGL